MKISEVQIADLISYLRLDEPPDEEIKELEHEKSMAISLIVNYTGLEEETLDDYPDITHAFFLLVSDMHENRNLEKNGVVGANKAVDTILSLHSVNLL